VKKKKRGYRKRFPEDERKHTWLPILLDALAIIDEGVEKAIFEHERANFVRLACKAECSSCCRTHKDVPIYPLEMVGIYWYAIEKISEPERGILKKALLNDYSDQCPFLINDKCVIHVIRPIGCRQFNVFGQPCSEGEDPFFSRRHDVLTPKEEYTYKAFWLMLPFYGYVEEKVKEEVMKNRLIHSHARAIASLKWRELANRMTLFDKQSE